MNNLAFDLVIFDCDSVLVESEELACRIYVDIFHEYGFELDYTETLDNRVKISAQELGWTPPAEFIPNFLQRQLAASETELKPIPHIHELIKSITLPICVASNGKREEILMRLRVAKLTDYFGDAIFSGTEVPHPKPAPDVYLAAAKHFNIHPSRCVVIEDSVLGVTAGVAAGMKVYGHAAFNSAAALRAVGAIPFTSILELKEILASESSPVA